MKGKGFIILYLLKYMVYFVGLNLFNLCIIKKIVIWNLCFIMNENILG